VKFTLNLLGRHRDEERRWPDYLFGGHVRTSTLALIVAFLAVWWVQGIYRNAESPSNPPSTQWVPPGFVPDPNYTWVPRTRVEEPAPTSTAPETPTATTTTTTSSTPTTTTTTPPPPFQLPCLLPPQFCPPTASPTASSPAQQPLPGPGPSPSSVPPAS
jgi:cytoskeletal protein RodZ